MPVMSGPEATAAIRRQALPTRVIVLTSVLEDAAVTVVIRAWAMGYLVQETSRLLHTDACALLLRGEEPGPLGPADHGAQWEDPYAWGMWRPLYVENWYKNRLRVKVVGAAPGEAEVQLTNRRGDPLPTVETLGNLTILHMDPSSGVVAIWPDP